MRNKIALLRKYTTEKNELKNSKTDHRLLPPFLSFILLGSPTDFPQFQTITDNLSN